MKLPKKKEHSPATKPPHKKRARTSVVGAKKTCFFVGDSLDGLDDLNARLTKLKSKPLKQSFVFREGAKLFIERTSSQVKLAEKGELHAKKRKSLELSRK